MKLSVAITLALAVVAGDSTASAELKVVTTVPDLAALVSEIGGNKVEVTSLSLPTQDPHFVDAKPSLALRLSRADLLIVVGLDLEVGWLPKLQRSARNPKILTGRDGYLDCSTVARKLEVPRKRIDRSMGDIHPGGNPHYLYSPHEALRCARAIAEKLARLDPGNARTFRRNAGWFEKRLRFKIARWKEALAPHRGAPVVSYHRSWVYLLDWLGLEDLATFEPKPGIPPSPAHVAKVMRVARSRGVKVILQESYYPSKTARLVGQKIGASVVELPAGAEIRRGESYIQRMDRVVAALTRALGSA